MSGTFLLNKEGRRDMTFLVKKGNAPLVLNGPLKFDKRGISDFNQLNLNNILNKNMCSQILVH